MNRFKPRPAGTHMAVAPSAVARGRLRAAALALAALTASAVAAGCTAPAASPPAAAASGTAAATPASSASASPAASTSTAKCGDVYASSLRPLPGSAQVTAGSYMQTIKARGYLVAGVDANTYHFEYRDPRTGDFEGFDIDMIQAVAHAIFGSDITGRIQYKAITNDQREPDVENGIVDIVAHTMTITCVRLKDVAFSTVYFDAHQEILVLDGSTVTGAASLAGQKVCATANSTSATNIEAYHPKLVTVPYNTDCLVMLQQGQVAAITSDNTILEGLKAQDPFTKIVGGALNDQPYGLAIAKTHPEFVQFVNAVLHNERTSGAWKASYAYWVGTPVPQPPREGYAS